MPLGPQLFNMKGGVGWGSLDTPEPFPTPCLNNNSIIVPWSGGLIIAIVYCCSRGGPRISNGAGGGGGGGAKDYVGTAQPHITSAKSFPAGVQDPLGGTFSKPAQTQLPWYM